MLTRSAIVAAVIVALGYGFARGVLGLVTDLEWSALTSTERWVVIAAIGLPLVVLAGLVMLRGWWLQPRHAYFADLGFQADAAGVHRTDGGWFALHAGQFEASDGARRPAWIVDAQGRTTGPEILYYAKDPPGERGTRELDDAMRAELDGITELIQLRVASKHVRIVLERETPLPNLRRAIAVVGKLAERTLPATAAEPSPPTIPALARHAPSHTFTIAAVIAYFAAVIVVGALAPDHEGYEDFIMARTRACGLAREVLGEPIERTQFGWQPSGKSNRRQTSMLLVHGPRAKGEITVEAYVRTRGTDPRAYPIIRAVMEAPGGAIEILACSRSWKSGIDAPRTWAARKRGDASLSCTVRVEPLQEKAFRECRLEVACDGRRLYGATPELGFADCWTVRDRGRADIVVSDPDRGLERPEPTVELDERTGTVQLGRDYFLELLPGQLL